MNFRKIIPLIVVVLGPWLSATAFAQATLTEDFTTTASSNSGGVGNWLVYYGACLTAGTTAVPSSGPVTNPVSIPACVIDGTHDILGWYYKPIGDSYMVGGSQGYLGSTSSGSLKPDASGSGALRFTNGYTGSGATGRDERGAIVSANAYPGNQGIQVTFKTVTYYGDSGGAAGDGADGISFYLLDGCMPLAGAIAPPIATGGTPGCSPNDIYGTTAANMVPGGSTYPATPATSVFLGSGAVGGSLAYTCSNETGNYPQDGLAGAYLGLGIDEFGNFLNGSSNTQSTAWSVTNGGAGDNTATGGGYEPGRIGLRGAGNVSWQALTNAFGTRYSATDTTHPYYPASLAVSCSSGTYDSNANSCVSCPGTGYTYAASSQPGQVGSCSKTVAATPASCSAGTIDNSVPGCYSCNNNYTYTPRSPANGSPGECVRSGHPDESPTSDPGAYKAGTSATTLTESPTTATPASNTASAESAVQKTCQSGHLWNYASGGPYDAGPATLPGSGDGNGNAANLKNVTANSSSSILDYAAIPGGYQVLSGTTPSGTAIQIADEAAKTRGAANPILYNLQITPDGLLSLSYSYDGAAYQPILKNQSVTASNGPLPAYVRYGFAGSTGGDSNIHEVLCFKSQPINQAQSSAGVNQRQSAEIQPNGSAFAYFSFYDTLDWAGRLTANALNDTDGVLTVNQVPTWDGSCTLTGSSAPNCAGYPTTPMLAPSARTILSWNNGSPSNGITAAGVAFEASGLTAGELANLNLDDPTSSNPSTNPNRLEYLRGDRTNEVANATPPCPQYQALNQPCFRARDSVLGDIIDSSPVWVGPPQLPYTAAWSDRLNVSASAPENSGTQTYLAYQSLMQTRTNVVYVGANDGMLHGFRSGAYTSTGSFDTTAPNDGEEVLAYVPGAVIQSPASNNSSGCPTAPATLPNPMAATLSVVQNIHGVTPTTNGNPSCTAPSLDYSNVYYGHNTFVDATPGTGDLFYGGQWHTWLVGGLGAGGAAIYALDVSDPGNVGSPGAGYTSFSEANAAQLVIGEWNPATITCSANSTCGQNMGATYGTPIIRRLHDGKWAVIFGNGFGSATGDAGIYVMTIGSAGAPTIYYLSAGVGTMAHPGGDGIAYVTSADLDGDHITDYVYAGDLKGNVWRFDLTSSSESIWIANTPFKLFQTPTGQPITTAVTVASGSSTAGENTLMIAFGTGQKTQLTNLAAVSYASGTQYLYGVWDWNLSTWNSESTAQYAALTSAQVGTGGSGLGITFGGTDGSQTLGASNLQSQVVKQNATENSSTSGDVSASTVSATICWASAACTGSNAQFGWYLNLPGTQTSTGVTPAVTTYEQIVYSPLVLGSAFVVNSTIPAINSTLSCSTATDSGYTYAVSVMGGNAIPSFFIGYKDTEAFAEQADATGTSFPITTADGQNWLVYQTVSNTPSTLQVDLGANYVGRRLTWVQLR